MAINLKIVRKIPVDPTFFLLFIWYFISGRILYFFVFFLALLNHEFGHYFIAKKLHYKLNSFRLNFTGARLNYESGIFENSDEIKIAVAGPLVNIISAILITSLWWIFPIFYHFTYSFVCQNLFLGLFNLLPVFPLDGGRIMLCYFSKYYKKQKVLKFLKLGNIVFSCLFFILFFISCFTNYNPTLALMVIFLIGGLLSLNDEAKYERLYLFKKRKKNFSKIRTFYVYPDTMLFELINRIESAKYTNFYVQFSNGKYKIISEDVVLKLSLNFDLKTKLNDIFEVN